MSKLLKAIVTKHRPAIAAKMTAANGYDETKHTHASDLKKAGVINNADFDDLASCLDDLAEDGHPGANTLKRSTSAKAKEKLNDADFVRSLMALDSDDGDNGGLDA